MDLHALMKLNQLLLPPPREPRVAHIIFVVEISSGIAGTLVADGGFFVLMAVPQERRTWSCDG